MRKIAVFFGLFLLIFPQVFADEDANEFESIFFTWQLYSYLNENNPDLYVFENLNQNINTHFNRLLDDNSLQNSVASFIGFSLLLASIINSSINWREHRIYNQERRIQNEIWGDPWEQQKERLREIEIIERGFHSDSSRIIR